MKYPLIATLVATSLSMPAAAAPGSFFEDLLAGISPPEEAVVVSREVLAAADDARVHAEAMRRWAEDFNHEMRESLGTLYAPRIGSRSVVKGAPYSAEVVTETNQTLADGNIISHKTLGAAYRDAEGRTRQDSGSDGKRPGTVYISDPVEGRYIVLLPGSKRAIISARPAAHAAQKSVTREKQVVRLGSTEIRVEDGRVFVNGKEATGTLDLEVNGKKVRVENGRVTIDGKDVKAGEHQHVIRTVNESETGDGTRREEVRVQVVRSGDRELTIPLPPTPPVPPVPGVAPIPPVPPLPPMAGVHTLRFESTARLGKGVTAQLGSKDVEGVRAEGKATTWTIAAGEIGNRNPIKVVSESWYSPELQVTVYSRYNDPRTGESIYRLANVRRAEPARDLFTVPEGYETRGKSKTKEEKR